MLKRRSPDLEFDVWCSPEGAPLGRAQFPRWRIESGGSCVEDAWEWHGTKVLSSGVACGSIIDIEDLSHRMCSL